MGGFAVDQAYAQDFTDPGGPAPPQPLSWTAAFGAQVDDGMQTQAYGARAEALRGALWERHKQIEQALGKSVPKSAFMYGWQMGEQLEPLGEHRTLDQVDRSLAPEYAAAHPFSLGRLLGMEHGPQLPTDDEYEAQIAALQQKTPAAFASIQSRAQLQAALDARLTAVRARAAQGQADHPTAGLLGGVTGALADPVNVAAMAGGGEAIAGVRGIAARMLTMGTVNAAATVATIPGRMRDAALAGPEMTAGDAAGEVAGSFVGGAALDLGFQGLGALARRVLGRFGPAESLAAADPAVRGAAQATDQAWRDGLALGPLDGPAHEEGLAALQNLQPRPQVEPAQELGELFADVPAPTMPGPVTGVADYMGRRIYQASFDPKALEVDPARFQFKSEGDAQGVTARLRGVEAWDPTASGKVVVWEDAAGRRFIADGHQRLGLARRLDAKGFEPKLDGYLFREADGWTSRQARTVGALKNIREGSGSILDAAKVFRDAPDALRDPSLPVTGDFITRAKALAQLEPQAFGAVVNGVIPERYGAEIGAMAGDRPDLHAGLVKLLREGQPASIEEARAMISEAKLDDWIKSEGEDQDLFGGLAPESTTIARAKVKAAVLNALQKDARVYGQLVRHADAIEAGGNVLLRDQNEAAAVINRTALEVLSRLSLRSGEVGEAMAKAAREVLDGARPAEAARGIVSMVRHRLKAGEALEGLRLAAIDPPPPTEAAQAAAAEFSDPNGKGAKAQLEEKPEEAQAPPALMEDLEEAPDFAGALKRLAPCAPGE